MKRYAAALYARRFRGLEVENCICVAVVGSTSEAGAERAALIGFEEKYPESDGWQNRDVIVEAIADPWEPPDADPF